MLVEMDALSLEIGSGQLLIKWVMTRGEYLSLSGWRSTSAQAQLSARPCTPALPASLRLTVGPLLILDMMRRIMRSSIKLYVAIHGLPILLFKRKELRERWELHSSSDLLKSLRRFL